MSRAKFPPDVYRALKHATHPTPSNREIARLLDVDEASVRRGLQGAEGQQRPVRQLLNELADALERAGL